MSCGRLRHRAIDLGLLASACFRCKAPAGAPCRTESGALVIDPNTRQPDYHQRRLDLFWKQVKATDAWDKYLYRLPMKRGEQAVLS